MDPVDPVGCYIGLALSGIWIQCYRMQNNIAEPTDSITPEALIDPSPIDDRVLRCLQHDCDDSFVYVYRKPMPYKKLKYCRPSCKCRKSMDPKFIQLFDSAKQAENAGYEPCGRCRPSDPMFVPPAVSAIVMLYSLLLEPNARISSLMIHSKKTKYHSHRLFRDKCCITPKQYATLIKKAQKAGAHIFSCLDERMARSIDDWRYSCRHYDFSQLGGPQLEAIDLAFKRDLRLFKPIPHRHTQDQLPHPVPGQAPGLDTHFDLEMGLNEWTLPMPELRPCPPSDFLPYA